MEIHLIEGLGTSDHDPVVPKEQSAQCGDKCDGPEIAEMKSRVWRDVPAVQRGVCIVNAPIRC